MDFARQSAPSPSRWRSPSALVAAVTKLLVSVLSVTLLVAAPAHGQNRRVASGPMLADAGSVLLPFRNISNDPGMDCLGDGIAETLVTDWPARVAGNVGDPGSIAAALTVLELPRTSTRNCADARALGRQAGARWLIHGGYQRVGARIRVTAPVVDCVFVRRWHPFAWSLFRDIGGDLVRFFTSGETYAILGLGIAGSLLVAPVDDDVRNSRFTVTLTEQDDTALDEVFSLGHVLGSTNLQFGAALATYGIGRVVGATRAAALGRDLLRAQLLSGGLTQFAKHTARRARPATSTRTSFPSGHTSGTFASAAVLQRHFGWKAGIPAFGVASYVAASRVADNQHFLSDVAFGAAIGVAAGRTVTFDRGAASIELAPLVVSRGAGLRVSVFSRSQSAPEARLRDGKDLR